MGKGIQTSLLLFLYIAIAKVQCECPDDALLTPCFCIDDEHITCDGDKPINFCEMFQKLTKKVSDKEKDYEMFILSNTAVQEIPENCFGDIFFREIHIQNAINLKKIHSNAFTGTDQFTERFLFMNGPNFDSSNIFDVLSKFKRMDAISIGDIGLKEIPSNAFKGKEQLVWLWISGLTIEKIDEKAFSGLNGLAEIHITNTSITEVPKDAFVFVKSENPIEICLYNNQKMTAFNEHVFTQTGRTTELDFSGERFSQQIYGKQVPVLEEKVFLPFLEADELNKIEMIGQQFDCNECKNAWVKKVPKMSERLENIKCADGKEVTDSFTNCK